MADVVFATPELQEQAASIIARYPSTRSALMPLLYLAQSVQGHVSSEGMREIALLLDITTAEVEAVASFYTMFRMGPTGTHLLDVCTNVSCKLRGADELLACAKEALGPGCEGVTEDGVFTLHEEECLGACETAPVVQVNFANYDNVTREQLLDIVEKLRAGEEPPAPSRGPLPKDFKEASRVLAGVQDLFASTSSAASVTSEGGAAG